MTSPKRDTVIDKLQEAITVLESSLIRKKPYVKDSIFKTNYLTQWQDTGSCMAFMEPAKKGVGVAMLIGAERRNIITYAISNKAGRFIQFDLAMLNKKVTIGWPSVQNLKTKINFVKVTKLCKQEVPMFLAQQVTAPPTTIVYYQLALPTGTAIASKTLNKQTDDAWQRDKLMDK